MNRILLLITLMCSFLAVFCQSVFAIDLEIREGRPVVNGVYVNGHGPYRFLIDTGATLNHIEPELAESIGLNVKFHTDLRTSTGVVRASGSNNISVTLSKFRADQQTFLFEGMSVVHKLSREIQGILGQDFLSRFDYFLDSSTRQIVFGTREGIPKEMRTVFRTDQGRPVIATSLGWLILDSGAHKLTRFGISSKEVASDEPAYQMFTMSGAVPLGTLSSKLVIDGRTFWHGDAIALPRSTESAAGLLPTSIFKSVYVCNSEGFVVFY